MHAHTQGHSESERGQINKRKKTVKNKLYVFFEYNFFKTGQCLVHFRPCLAKKKTAKKKDDRGQNYAKWALNCESARKGSKCPER